MKKSVFWGAAAALALITPGVASAEMNGYAGVQYGWLDDADDNTKEAASAWFGGFTTDLYGNWDFQFDANASDMDHGGHTHAWGSAQGHAFLRNDRHAFGVFASQLNIDSDNFYGLGVEGAMYWDRFTLSGQAGWAQATYDNPDDITNFGGQGTFFVNDNFTVGAELGWTDSEWEGEESFTYGLNSEFQFTGSPFSASLSWVHADSDYDGGGSHEVDAITIGGRLNFNTSDLRDRDRNGASFVGLANAVRDSILMW